MTGLDEMSYNKSYRLYVKVQQLNDSVDIVDAVYRAVSKLVSKNHEDGLLWVYENQRQEQESGERTPRWLVIEFASPKDLEMIDKTKPLDVNGEKLGLLWRPDPEYVKEDSGSIDYSACGDCKVSYNLKTELHEEDVEALKILLSPASGVKLRYKRNRLIMSLPHSDSLRVQAQLKDALNYLTEIHKKNFGEPGKNNEAIMDCFKPELEIRLNAKTDNSNQPKVPEAEVLQECPICMDSIDQTDSHKLPCGHAMHSECYTNFVKNHFYKCPQCQKVIATPNGNQPDGTMSVRQQSFKLSGHEKDSTGTYQITYNFPDGTQTDRHPKPGARYWGTTRVAYLPMSREGERVLKLLDRAFNARLTFTIGQSNTTGADDSVVWNNIHHKTSMSGSPYGYPDAGYLKRVTEELAAVGVTDD